MNAYKLDWMLTMLLLLFLAGTSFLAVFGINHADESLLVAIASPLILVTSVAVGVTISVARIADILSKRRIDHA